MSQRLCFRQEVGDGIEIEGIAEGVGDDDGPGARRDGGLKLSAIDVVGAELNVNEDGERFLDDGIEVVEIRQRR